MTRNSSIWLALDLLQSPSSVKVLRAAPIPGDVIALLRIAAGDDEASRQAAGATQRSLNSIREAAAFYIEQILLHRDADHYRVLGAHPGASTAELRRNMALLIRWLHPDQNRAERSVFAARVTKAWSELKNEDKRAAYDLSRRRASEKTAATTTRHTSSHKSKSPTSGHRHPHRFPGVGRSAAASNPGMLMRMLLVVFGRSLH